MYNNVQMLLKPPFSDRSDDQRCQEDFLGFLKEATKEPEKLELSETDEIKVCIHPFIFIIHIISTSFTLHAILINILDSTSSSGSLSFGALSQAIEESLVDRLDELSKLAPEISQLKASPFSV